MNNTATPRNRAPQGRRSNRRHDWVHPRPLLIVAGVLVVISTLVVAIRERVHPQRTEWPAHNGSSRTNLTEALDALFTGAQDTERAAEFHRAFAERLPSALRRIGFRPALTSREERDGSPVRWTIRVPENFPILRVNAEVTLTARKAGGEVFRAEQDPHDLKVVHMSVGAGNIVTDRISLRQESGLRFKGAIGLIVDDVGYRPLAHTMKFIRLPYMLTFSILPGHEGVAEIAEAARAAGKDVMVHLPMEPHGEGNHLEPNTIMTTMDDRTIRELVAKHLDSVPGAIGVNNHMGSKATEDPRVMRAVLSVLQERGLFFIDSRTSSASIAEEVARQLGILTGRRHIFLDNDRATDKVTARMHLAARRAEREGYVIALGHDREETYWAFAEMLPQLEEAGFRICPVKELLR